MSPAIGQQDNRLYEFGAFRLDPAERVLVRDGERVSLPPKAFETLFLLVQHGGHVLTKEQLIRTLWPDSFVEENNLTQQISQLRRALGEGTDGRSYIETVPKLGYRFIPDVREVVGGDLSAPRRTGSESPETGDVSAVERPDRLSLSERRRGKPAFVALTIIACVLAVAAGYRFAHPRHAPAAVGRPRTVAVIPLRNLKRDPATDFLSLALADAIISRLAYVDEIAVQPLSSVAKYRDGDIDARQVARELKVENVLAGSYIKEGDDLRVTIEFMTAGDNAHPRRENVDMKYERLLTVQDRVAISVIHSMGFELRPDEVERMQRGVPSDPEAYEYFLRGIDQGFKSDFDGAVKLLEESVARDPGNAMAWDQLATVYLADAGIQGGDSRYADKGWAAFHRAIDLDPTNRFIVDTMAFQLLEHNEAKQAIPLLRESLRYNPTDSFAHWYLSEAYRYGGALDESVTEGELALRLNPRVAENLTFNTYLYTGQYRRFLESLPRDDDSARTAFYRGLACYYLTETKDAVREFDRAFALNPSLLHSLIGRALTCALHHQENRGLQIMATVERAGSDDGEMLYKMAQAYAQLGDHRSSVRLFRRSVEQNFYPYTYFVRDPLLKPIRGESEYSAAMEVARHRQEAFMKGLRGSA